MIDDYDNIEIENVEITELGVEKTESSTSFESSYAQEDFNLLESSSSLLGLDYDSINSAESFLHHYSGSLTLDDVNASIQSASDFFNLESPMIVSEGWTTGVFNRNLTTVNDDVLIFNPDQLQSMGITEKEGLDLVMTHENTHRALQGLETGFSEHQEELCCDYMSGVRAGLNSMNTEQMINSLAETPETITHPAGELRVEAIKEGQEFASNFLAENGHAPTFNDCLEHFKSSDAFSHTADPLALVQNDSFNDSSLVSFGSKYTDAEISKMKSDVDHAQSEVTARRSDVSNWESKVSLNDTTEHRTNGDYAHAVSKLNEAKSRYNHAVDELNNAKRRLNNAT